MKKVLILCTGNSCRSQMAEAYLGHYAGSKAKIYSAGLEAHGVNPFAIAVMKEDGIDILNHRSKKMEEFTEVAFDFVVTVCDHAKESCPVFSTSGINMHHNFPDPANARGTETEILQEFRNVREQIKKFCQQFADDYLT